MAVAAGPGRTRSSREGGHSGLFWFRVLAWLGFVAVATSLALLATTHEVARRDLDWSLLPWIVMVAAAGMMPLRLRGVEFVMDLPLLLAAAIVLGPLGSGIVALCGATDVRELRLDVSVRFLWNRAQTAVCTVAAALVFEASGAGLGEWPLTAVAGLSALSVDIVLNYCLVALGAALFHQQPIRLVLQEMSVGSRAVFILTHAGIGFTGVLIAEIYRTADVFGLAASSVPLLLAYQSLRRRRELDESSRVIQLKDAAVLESTRRIAEERRQERLVVAGALHDDVLPPLFKVHLMGQVLHRDLSSGRLLDLDKDVPELLEATDIAQGAIRGVVRNLRQSAIGSEGLQSALELLVGESDLTNVHLTVGQIQGSPSAQLLIYQVVREALANVYKHARTSLTHVEVWGEEGQLRAIVRDQGPGFHLERVDRSAHFGLQLMAERVHAAGGELAVDSRPGEGTCIAVRVPDDA